MNRRQLLAAAGLAGLGPRALSAADPPAPTDPAEALSRLRAGNARFAAGQTRHAHESADWRKHLVGDQKPFATVLGCSDSRVPPELVFDQGFGDLFVVRVAGNVIAADVVGSLAYAALHLGTPLFVVLGHGTCGAVTAALDARLKKAKEPERIEVLLKLDRAGAEGPGPGAGRPGPAGRRGRGQRPLVGPPARRAGRGPGGDPGRPDPAGRRRTNSPPGRCASLIKGPGRFPDAR